MKRFFECTLPITACNLQCHYCYIIQENRRTNKQAILQYSPEHIGRALSIARLGGVSFINICGSGETLLQHEIADIVYHILLEGHFINITTNGTITKKFHEIISLTTSADIFKRLHFSFSFHYLELKRTDNIETFFDNIRLVKESGCSFVVQVNLYDEYIPYWDEIKKIVQFHTGALPQVAVTRNESKKKITIFTEKNIEEYSRIGKEMESPLFEFGLKNFMVKRHEFCYAGDWSGKLNLATGILSSCYGMGMIQNIFANIDKPIKFEAIGKNCEIDYCFNSTHFMALGIIPTINTQSYACLRNRAHANWYSDEMNCFLDHTLRDDNTVYLKHKEFLITLKYRIVYFYRKVNRKIKSIAHHIINNTTNSICKN
jgi:pyruvate-formate lyase-activating enzyme